MAKTMEWQRLLASQRLGRPRQGPEGAAQKPRTEFSRDYDRVIFSSAFRRLQDKTQVFPLARSDYVRTRLTHSLEAASVGRSLGLLAGAEIRRRDRALKNLITDHDIGAIVATAALAHDIGNPPFGHAGEAAIQDWFDRNPDRVGWKRPFLAAQREDLRKFEGNAFGFRTLCCLQNPDQRGGMQLTWATLGAFTKYPRPSVIRGKGEGVSGKKFGFMYSERGLFEELAAGLGLLPKPGGGWCRHPLAFLSEAADDICYRVMDVEDGFKAGVVSYDQLVELHGPLAVWQENRLAQVPDKYRKAEYLRATSIDRFIREAFEVFRENQDRIIQGRFDEALVSCVPSARSLNAFKDVGKNNVYCMREVVEVEASGFKIIGGLLSAFMDAIEDTFRRRGKRTVRSRTLLQLLPTGGVEFERIDWYNRALHAVDFVAGMTDSYAVHLYERIAGTRLR